MHALSARGGRPSTPLWHAIPDLRRQRGPADSVGTVDMRAALNDEPHLEKGGDGRAGSALARAGPVRENGGSKIVATLSTVQE